jgi:hypothetical protein
MVSIHYDEETGILKCTYSVSVDFEDLDRFVNHLTVDERLPDPLLVLHQAASCGSTLKMRELLHFSKDMKRGTGKFKAVRAAFYTKNPLTLTLSKLYERLNMDENTKYKTFNSERAAVAWLVEI